MVSFAHRSSLIAGLFVLTAVSGCTETVDETAQGAEQELGSCVKCAVVADKLHFDRLGGLTTDGTTLAWFDEQNGDHLWTVGTDGSKLRAVETCRGNHRLPTIEDEVLYFDTCGAACQVNRIPLDAVAKTCEVVLPRVDGERNGFFIDASTNALFAQSSGMSPKLQRVDLATLSATTIPSVSWSFEASYADASGIYGNVNSAGGSSDNIIVQLDRTTLKSTQLARGVTRPNATGLPPQVLFADALDVYFFSNSGLYRVARAGGAAVQVPGPTGAWDLRIDGSDVVWFQLDKPNIYRMPIKGGAVTTITTGSFHVRALAFDSKRYYFMETSSRLGYEAGEDWTLRATTK